MGDFTSDSRDTDGRSVGLAHVQASEDDLVEARVCSSGKEAVELQRKVRDIVSMTVLPDTPSPPSSTTILVHSILLDLKLPHLDEQ